MHIVHPRTQYGGIVMVQMGMFRIVPIVNLGVTSLFWNTVIRMKAVCYDRKGLLVGLWRIRLISFNLDLWSRSFFMIFQGYRLPSYPHNNEWDGASIHNLVEWRNIHPIPLPRPPWVFSHNWQGTKEESNLHKELAHQQLCLALSGWYSYSVFFPPKTQLL